MIVDDHSLIREGLRRLLELERDINVTGQASNGREAVEMALSLKPDVILMDINMPLKNGLEAIKELRVINCRSRIVVITIHGHQEYLLEAIRMGAAGYVMKDAEVDRILEAIRSVHAGNTYIQPSITNMVVMEELNAASVSHKSKVGEDNLTRREIQVLLLIADGKSNREIADDLYISEKTVKNHVSNIFKKIEVVDRTQAAVYAYKNKIV
jgi:DNA-binding NarL/FixJ family response regulator